MTRAPYEDPFHGVVLGLFVVNHRLCATDEEDRWRLKSTYTGDRKRVLQRGLFAQPEAGSTREEHAAESQRRASKLQFPHVLLSVVCS